jgi:hypothetical protein
MRGLRDVAATRFDRARWWAIRRLVGSTPTLELVGYALARAGYTDHPHVTDDFLTMYATGSDAWRS